MLRPVLALLLTAAVVSAADPGDGSEQHGMDVLGAAKTVKSWFGPGDPPSDKPWANALAGITDPDPRIHSKAIRELVTQGQRNPAVLTDLAILADDRDSHLRARLVQVCAAIGGTSATPLLLRFSNDRERGIRELAALGLAQGTGEAARERLITLLTAPESEIRQAAAQSLGAFGDPAGIASLTRQEQEPDDLVKRAMRSSMSRLCAIPANLGTAIALLETLTDQQRDCLLEAVVDLPDTRLCPVLTAIARQPSGRSPEASAWTQFLAVRGLSAAGDWRAVRVLAALADSTAATEVASSAATTLRLITGYGAAPGKAWKVWMTDNDARTSHLAKRDDLLASYRDPQVQPTQAALAAWAPAELEPLVLAVLGRPSGRITPAWSARALGVLRADDPLRWCPLLAERINATPSTELDVRLGLIALLDDLAPVDRVTDLAAVGTALKQRMEEELEKSKELKLDPVDHQPEITLLSQALERRGVRSAL